ncbi:hypothetical protein V6N13_109654 [Hibiscus sabdariffa]
MLSSVKGRTIFEVAKGNSLSDIEWSDLFFRPLLDREMTLVDELTKDIDTVSLCGGREDELTWVHDRAGAFMVKKLSELLIDADILEPDIDYAGIWKLRVPPKGEQAACGGLLVMKGSEVRALFSGPIVDCGKMSIALRVVKVLEIFKKVGWARKSALVVELDNKLLIKWLVNAVQRPWGYCELGGEVGAMVSVFVDWRGEAWQRSADVPNLFAYCMT